MKIYICGVFSVAILGASSHPSRYAYLVQEELQKQNYLVFPINPGHQKILETPCLPSLLEVQEPVSVVTVYISAQRVEFFIDDFIALKPRLVIFNPGAENSQAYQKLSDAGIRWMEACTFVLLKTRRFSTILDDE